LSDNIEALILACTHYPVVKKNIAPLKAAVVEKEIEELFKKIK